MNINSAISQISASTSGGYDAAKIPSWGGYVYKCQGGVSDEDFAAGKYELRFVQRDGDQYVYTFDGNGDFAYTGKIAAGEDAALGEGDPVLASTLVLDMDLLEAILSDAWITGSKAAYEDARTGEGEW